MSHTACWGTNKLEKCAWISFGYGSVYDTCRFWISLETAKILARYDLTPNINDPDWHDKENELKSLCPRLRMRFSAWNVEVPDDTEESLRWWEEIEKEMGLYGSFNEYENHPEDKEILDRCRMMEDRASEAIYGFPDVCHDETGLNFCTHDKRHPNGGGNFKQFLFEEEIILSGNDDIDALIIAKIILQQHLKIHGEAFNLDDEINTQEYNLSEINIFDPENSTKNFVERIEIDESLFTFHLYTENKYSYFVYTFDRSDAKPDLDYIKTRKEEILQDKLDNETLQENEMLEWGVTFKELYKDPNNIDGMNFHGDIFNPNNFSVPRGFGHYRFAGSAEPTKHGDWLIFGGSSVHKEYVSSPGRSTGRWNGIEYRNYVAPSNDRLIFGGYRESNEMNDYLINKDLWENPELP